MAKTCVFGKDSQEGANWTREESIGSTVKPNKSTGFFKVDGDGFHTSDEGDLRNISMKSWYLIARQLLWEDEAVNDASQCRTGEVEPSGVIENTCNNKQLKKTESLMITIVMVLHWRALWWKEMWENQKLEELIDPFE
jgi:hypothetical protein